MTRTTLSLLALTATASSGFAASTLTTGNTNLDNGGWDYQTFTLSDPGYTTGGDPLGSTLKINSISLVKAANDFGSTPGLLWLTISTDPTDIASVVAHSDARVDVFNALENSALTWTFDGPGGMAGNLDSSTTYYLSAYLDAGGLGVETFDNTDLAAGLRVKVTNDVIGGVANGIGANGDDPTGRDFSMTINVSEVPEPSSAALLGLGALTLLLRRKK